ncbi:phage major capsid protein [Phenylobacterium sp.]|uniref:phage major capsid protein n=1 Tax=Phenylobacterium sp. TaxID=1871053 RepID=UPI0035AF58D1
MGTPTRSDKDYADLIGKFELRQVALMLDEGRALDGATAEVVQELRAQGGYRGVPVPWQALEKRAGETVASGTPNPIRTLPIIDRIFADSAAVRMGASMVNIDQGLAEYPVTTSSVAAGWATTETGSVAGPTAYATTDRPLAPNNTLGVTMKITRKTLKQSGDALEQAVRRDMNGAIGEKLDAAVFLGAGASGEPAGVLVGSYGITSTAVNAAATWAAFRSAVTRFIVANAASGPGAVKLLIRPEIFDFMDDTLIDGTAVSEWDRLIKNIPLGNIVMSSNALAAPTGGPPTASKALLTTTVGGVPPIFVGTWGAIDLIRDPYSDAASGGLRLTALTTMDVTVSRSAQLQILTGVENALEEEGG